MSTEQELRHYYWMVSGTLIVASDEETTIGIMQNAMVVSDKQHFGLYQISKAQMALQQVLIKKMGEVPKIVDVIIVAVTHLGHMTEAEFNWRPDELQLQQMTETAANSVFQAADDLRAAGHTPATVIDLNARRPTDG